MENLVIFGDKLPTNKDVVFAFLNGKLQRRLESKDNQNRLTKVSHALLDIYKR